ncbi:MAG: tyramine oxidase subunit B [Lachnospiraceae bacterium]
MKTDTAIDFLYLNEAETIQAGVTNMGECVEVMDEMFKLLSNGDYMMGGSNHNSHGTMVSFPEKSTFPNMPVDGPDRRFMAMPAYLGGDFDIAGMKWYGSNADNKEKGLPRSILMLMLNDKDTGAPKALMSANLESAYRTGAVPGVGAKYMAPKDARVLGIIGPGVMNKTSLESFVYARPTLETIKICGRSKNSIESYIGYVKEKYPQFKNIIVVDTVEDACRDTDILSVGVSSPPGASNYPFVKGEWMKPGALISAPAGMAMDEEFLKNKARKVVDNYGLYEAWVEEFPYPSFDIIPIIGVQFMDMLHDNKIRREDIIDIGDIITGKNPVRKSEDDVVVFSIGGMPVEDLAWGMTVYRKAKKMGLGTPLNLWNQPYLA